MDYRAIFPALPKDDREEGVLEPVLWFVETQGRLRTPRFRETVFGGTTRRMLAESHVPLLLAH